VFLGSAGSILTCFSTLREAAALSGGPWFAVWVAMSFLSVAAFSLLFAGELEPKERYDTRTEVLIGFGAVAMSIAATATAVSGYRSSDPDTVMQTDGRLLFLGLVLVVLPVLFVIALWWVKALDRRGLLWTDQDADRHPAGP